MSVAQSTIWGCHENEGAIEGELFSKTSLIDCLDITDGTATAYRNLDNGGAREFLQMDSGKVDCRILFIGAEPSNSNLLRATPEVFHDICGACGVSKRFLPALRRQHSPSRDVQYVKGKPVRQEFWYTAVLRSMKTPDLDAKAHSSLRVLGWTRVYIWAGYDLVRNQTRAIVLRGPEKMKEEMFKHFQDPSQTSYLTRHPMLLHAILVEDLIIQTYDFLDEFSNQIYALEPQSNIASNIHAYTVRSQAFLELARQITQTAGDYGILRSAIRLLQKEQAWVAKHWQKPVDEDDASFWLQNQEFGDDIFDYFFGEVDIVEGYSKLYEERAKIGINEGFNMVNQGDAEINLQMAAESTEIAKATRQDGQSLQALQILGTLFLPASLCSSILGMGFFTTQPDDSGRAQFIASNKWWIFIAFAIPLTIVSLGIVSILNAWQRWRNHRRRMKLPMGPDGVVDEKSSSSSDRSRFGRMRHENSNGNIKRSKTGFMRAAKESV
ncbi:MAG: hypothetical protein M1823_001156 [Watsoniomyces obsoletus]|nr:MAG: hypothetical protein M1823_001156 [Watsoniomyces obsoletus]